ncbi:MAG: ABC transporter permease DevC [Prochloraceae cyanobacterium]|nr:ABC transporter permease DevC [Prochloraceae cyanobacterium]
MLKRILKEQSLAWSQLVYQKVRLMVALSGICFANVLIFTQLGFKASLFNGAMNIPESLEGDLFLIDSKAAFLGNGSIELQQLYRAEGIFGVAEAKPLYYKTVSWLNPETKTRISINVLAFNPAKSVFNLPEINQQISLLQQPDTILFDRKSLASVGNVAAEIAKGKTYSTLVNERKINVGSIFSLGSTAFRRGHIITSDVNYLRIFGTESINQIQIGIISIEENSNSQKIIAALQKNLDDGIKVLDRDALIALEENYWNSQPAGVVFNFGIVMGFVVGVIIVYQVLYTDINEHLAEYATLKAIGYSDRSLLLIVFQEAAILAVLGFLPGLTVSAGLYLLLGRLTQTALALSFDVAGSVFLLTLLMCLLSGAIAARKLRSADPADVF